MTDNTKGACFCGAVRIEVEGPPAMQGYCHCEDCRAWSGAPVTGYSLWAADKVRVTAGEDRLKSYSKSGKAVRRHCADCGGSVMTEIPEMGMVDVYSPILDGAPFEPGAHIFYGVRMIDIDDGLPKFLDLPAEAGGSGKMHGD